MLPRRKTACWALCGLLGGASFAMGCGDGADVPEFEPPAGVSGAGGEPLGAAAAGGSDGDSEPLEGGDSGAGGASVQGSAGAGGESAALPPIQYCDAPTKVLTASCGNGSCHSNPGANIGDFAVGPVEAASFVDVLSVREGCGRIIDSRDYSQSLLLTKITGRYPQNDCGGRMPVGSFVITDDQTACLASWLQQFQR